MKWSAYNRQQHGRRRSSGPRAAGARRYTGAEGVAKARLRITTSDLEMVDKTLAEVMESVPNPRRNRVRLKPALAVAAAAFTLVAVSGIAGASVPGPDGVISACYLTRTGTVRIIDAATQSCKPSETAIDWNQAGTPGAPGAPGLSRYTQVSLDDNHTFVGDPVGFFGVTITCPTGRKVLGGGTNVSGFRGIEVLDRLPQRVVPAGRQFLAGRIRPPPKAST